MAPVAASEVVRVFLDGGDAGGPYRVMALHACDTATDDVLALAHGEPSRSWSAHGF